MAEYNNRNIVLHELVGLYAEVIASKDAAQVGIRGRVIDETKESIVLQTDAGRKRILKRISTFKFIADKNIFTVEGSEICFRPHERIGKGLKFYRKRKL
ncbi:MAG: ribonuclease P protein subunit [Candidatus Micrarchaeaceae archaeon]